MKHFLNSSRVGFVVAAVSLAALGGFGLRSVTAKPAMVSPTPAVIGVVDLERVISEKLTELKALNDKMEETRNKRIDELKALNKEVEKIEQDLKETPEDQTQRRLALIASGTMKGKLLETQKQIYEELTSLEKGEVIRNLYLKAVKAAEAYANANNFDLIMLDDRSIPVPPGRKDNWYSTTIIGKQILFAKSSIDITEAIVTMMNNDYSAGKGAAPAPTTPTPTPVPAPAPAIAPKK